MAHHHATIGLTAYTPGIPEAPLAPRTLAATSQVTPRPAHARSLVPLLTNNNAFTGAVSVQAGTLRFSAVDVNGNAQPLGAASFAITLGTATTSGTLEYTGTVEGTLARAITVNGVGGGILKNSGGAALTLSATLTRATRPLTFSAGAFLVTGQITGGASDLNIDGAAVTLSNTANNYVGPTNVFGGGILRNGASDVLTNGTTVVLGETTGNTGGTYDLNGFNETLTGISGAGTGSKKVTNSAASGTATLTLTGTSTFDGVIEDGLNAATALTKSTGGVLTLAGINTYTGLTSILAGTLSVNSAAALGSGTSAVTLGSTTLGTLAYTGSSATLSRDITVGGTGGGLISNSGSGTLTLAGTLTKDGTKLTLSGGQFIVSGQITGVSANSDLIVNNNAVVTLTNLNNNYNGPTLVNGGATLKNGVSNALPAGTVLTLGEATGNTNGTYDLNGFSSTIAGLNSAGTGSTVVTNGAANGTATLSVTGSGSFDGTIQDGATAATALTKSIGGTFTLTGNNTYSGSTNVTGGVLQVGQGGDGSSLANATSAGTTGVGATSVGAGGTIAGTGLIKGTFEINGGTLSPGDTTTSAGDNIGTIWVGDTAYLSGTLLFQLKAATLNVAGLADSSGGAYDATRLTLTVDHAAQLSGVISSLQHDHVEISGVFDWNATTDPQLVDISLAEGSSIVAGDVFNLLDWTSVVNPTAFNAGSAFRSGGETGTELDLPGLGGGLVWDTTLFGAHGILIVTQSVPEPGRALLFFMGCSTLLLRRRRVA